MPPLPRASLEDVVDPATGEVLFDKDTMLVSGDAKKLEEHGIHEVKVRSVLNCDAKRGVCARCYGINLATGEPVSAGEAVGVIAAQSIGEPGTQLTMRTFHTGGVAGDDITQGLPRVEELFEARKPKKMCLLAEISGTVSIEEAKKNTVNIIITNDEGESRTVQTTLGAGIRVKAGDHVEQGVAITDGIPNPHDVLRVRGIEACQNYLIQEVQKVYQQQGVDINNQHIEVIVRQMMRKVRIEDGGDSALIPGVHVETSELSHINEEIARRAAETGEEPHFATSVPVLLGITKASLVTESFMSAASFQETTKVLNEAAISGKTDTLEGMKENVICGHAIPAGTGLREFNRLVVGDAEEYALLQQEKEEVPA